MAENNSNDVGKWILAGGAVIGFITGLIGGLYKLIKVIISGDIDKMASRMETFEKAQEKSQDETNRRLELLGSQRIADMAKISAEMSLMSNHIAVQTVIGEEQTKTLSRIEVAQSTLIDQLLRKLK